MNPKNDSIILISVFYIFGLSAQICNMPVYFAIGCFIALCSAIFTNIISPKKAIVVFLIFIAGFYNAAFQTKEGDALKGIYANNVTLTGRVESIPQISLSGARAKFYLNVQNAKIYDNDFTPAKTKTLVSINDENSAFNKIKIGDTIHVTGNLRTPRPATNPSQFDYAKYLKYKDTFSILYSSGERFKIIKHADTLWWKTLAKLDDTRDKIIQKHSKYIKSPQLEILGGIVFGNEAINPPDDIKQSFINSGLLHLLAASGLNVALIFGLWWFFAQALKIPYVLSITGGMFFVILYTFMTGFPPSILRASIMILFVLAGKLIDREARPLALIFFVGFIMLVLNPKMFTDVGFQLSFVVTIGLICTVEPITSKFKSIDKKFREKLKSKPKLIRFILNPLAPCTIIAAILVPLSAQIFVAPLQMHYFNTFTPWSLFANLCVLPFIGVISFLGFISSIFGLIPFLGDKIIITFDIIVNPLLVVLVNISKFFSRLKYSIITMPSPDIFQMLLFWAIVILAVENIKKDFSSKKLIAALTTGILIFCLTLIKFSDNKFEILSFDVGNADSFLIKTPKNKYIMIDTGRLPYKGLSSAKMIMGEYLKDKNIRELEILIVTHFDNDHSGGAPDILKEFRVKNLYVQNNAQNSNIKSKILKLAKEKNINCINAKNNETIYREEDLEIKTFTARIKNGSENENSIVTLITSNNVNALFMADCGILGYERIKNYLPKTDILKVGHHGAKRVLSKQMLTKLAPNIAIISVGFNKYGHPDYKTLKLLNEAKVQTYITKELGAVRIFDCDKHKSCRVQNFDNGFKDTKIRPLKIRADFDKSDFAQELLKKSKVPR